MAVENAGIIVSVGSAIGTLIAVLTFWTKLTDRIAKAKDVAEKAQGIAENALQEAVEANQEFRNMRGSFEEMARDLRDEIELSRRETGESNAAIRQHVTEIAFFMRDNFVPYREFSSDMTEVKGALVELNKKLDRLTEQRPK
jgi:hypothetical protein